MVMGGGPSLSLVPMVPGDPQWALSVSGGSGWSVVVPSIGVSSNP